MMQWAAFVELITIESSQMQNVPISPQCITSNQTPPATMHHQTHSSARCRRESLGSVDQEYSRHHWRVESGTISPSALAPIPLWCTEPSSSLFRRYSILAGGGQRDVRHISSSYMPFCRGTRGHWPCSVQGPCPKQGPRGWKVCTKWQGRGKIGSRGWRRRSCIFRWAQIARDPTKISLPEERYRDFPAYAILASWVLKVLGGRLRG